MRSITDSYRSLPGEQTTVPLVASIEQLFSQAEPRLQRIARLQRVAPDAVDDVVQETLLEAWKSLDNLRDEARFAAWLDAICRNVCLRYQRKQGILRSREMTPQPESADEQTDNEIDLLAQLADPDSFDPSEELERRDMIYLVDRALGYLPPESRTAVEGHYLAEIPQRELAARMGLSLSALEARLHRARGQMLHTFSHDLRDEALALGLAILPADALGWRETSINCIFCGQQRMSGAFEPMPDGRVNMRLRCTACAIDLSSEGITDLATARTFVPAAKKVLSDCGHYIASALVDDGSCICWVCQKLTRLHIVRQRDCSQQTWLESDCGCLRLFVSADSYMGFHPAVRDFLFNSGSVLMEPEVEATYDGQSALRFGMYSPTDGRRLAVFADTHTLLPLAIIVE
jgi:RNA polymerase sigma-70 factor (ECF subfamily)